MKKKIIILRMFAAVLVFGMMVVGCEEIDEENNVTKDFTFTKEPISVQEKLNKTTIKQESASSVKIQSAIYDPELKYIIITCKVGTINNMFLHYLSEVIVAEAGREFMYTETRGDIETKQISIMNTTAVNFSATVYGAFAGANVFAGLSSLTGGNGPQAKANAYAAAGVVKFDFSSVTTTEYTENYTKFYIATTSIKQDMSIYPAGKEYAVASFADVGVYQIMKYNPETKIASAIEGESLYFNVESKPVWNMYEYSKETELSIPQQLKPFEFLIVDVKAADLFNIKVFEETRTNKIYSIGNDNKITDEKIFEPNLPMAALVQVGYKKLVFNVDFKYKGDDSILTSGTLRLRLADNDNSELGRQQFNYKSNWANAAHKFTISIDDLKNDIGQFKLRWSRVENWDIFNWRTEYEVGERTVTMTVEK